MDLEQLLSDLEAQITFAKMIPASSVQTIDSIRIRIQLFRMERSLSSESLPVEV
jgi:hypothetical protein